MLECAGGNVVGPDDQQAHTQVWLHRFALLTAVATFPLLVAGGVVTSAGAGLAVPDWPTTFGYNMFLYPWSKMVGGIFYEHSHRLIGALVGLLTGVLALWLWLKESRPWLRWLGGVALVAVIVQGVLGGLRVILLQHTLAIVHACLAQAFFALMVSVAVFTSAEWWADPQHIPAEDAGRLRRLCLLTTGLIYLQLVFGSIVRHTGARLDAHLLFAGLVIMHVFLLAIRVLRKRAIQPKFVRPIALLSGLLLAQLGLGLAAYIVKFTGVAAMVTPAARLGVTTAHVVVGSLMLASGLVLTLRAHRLPTVPMRLVATGVLSERTSV